jgi:toxin ParE1/3/4
VPRVLHTARARRDLIDIWLEVSADDAAAADHLYNRLEARVEVLKRFSEAGPRRPDIAPNARALVEPPYLILYRIIRSGVQIVRVLHSARNIDRRLFAEGLE